MCLPYFLFAFSKLSFVQLPYWCHSLRLTRPIIAATRLVHSAHAGSLHVETLGFDVAFSLLEFESETVFSVLVVIFSEFRFAVCAGVGLD